MKKPTFTDRFGTAWTIRDYRVADDGPEPVTLSDQTGEFRAFIPADGAQLLVYRFGDVSYRTTEPNVLEGQLLFAKPASPELNQRLASGYYRPVDSEADGI